MLAALPARADIFAAAMDASAKRRGIEPLINVRYSPSVEGPILAVSPFFVAEQLPASDPLKLDAPRVDCACEERFGESYGS